MILLFTLSAALAAQAPAVSDLKSSDAINVFDGMCVRPLLGDNPAIDQKRFLIRKVDEKGARDTLPEFDPDKAWGVLGINSKVEIYVGTGHGVCTGEVLAADQQSILRDFDQLVARTAIRLRTAALLESHNDKPINGKPAIYRAWRLKSTKGDIVLTLTAASDGAAEVQHLMTATIAK